MTVFSVNLDLVHKIPGTPFAYWIDQNVINIFQSMQPVKYGERDARSGGSTKDDFRFLRAYWETSPAQAARDRSSTLKGKRWVPFEKGGSISSFYRDWELVIDWEYDGKCVKQFVSDYRGSRGWGYDWSADVKGHALYFRPGLTWPRRADGLSFRILQAGCIFADKGPGIFLDNNKPEELLKLCAVLNSQAFNELVRLQLGRVSLAQSYEVGVIQRTPIPSLLDSEAQKLINFALEYLNVKYKFESCAELSHFFWLPALLQITGESLQDRNSSWQERTAQLRQQVVILQYKIDDVVWDLYGITNATRHSFESDMTTESSENDQISVGEDEDEGENDIEFGVADNTDHASRIKDLISYIIGCIFGRWDLRCATDEHPQPALPDPFAPLPIYSPGMLQPTADRLPVTHYQVAGRAFAPRPILVDDPGHPADLITCLQEVLTIIFGEQADAIYQELVDALVGNGHDLRPWLRTTFFDEHIKRYSKSRRKAPIYWCLTIPSRRYALWLYYHRLSRDTLYTVLNDYLGPKLDHEQRQLTKLRAEAGANPNAEQRRSIENQASLIAELQTLRDEVRRVAPLWQPDLNDGVIINFAPLWRLAPWPRRWQSDCQSTWEALRRGDYDWSHLALHLWPARVIAKCRTDRSLAIAHGLDEPFWQLDGDGKASPRPVTEQTVQALITAHTSAAVTAALAALDDAPVTLAKPVKAPPAPRTPRSPRARKASTADQQSRLDLQEGKD